MGVCEFALPGVRKDHNNYGEFHKGAEVKEKKCRRLKLTVSLFIMCMYANNSTTLSKLILHYPMNTRPLEQNDLLVLLIPKKNDQFLSYDLEGERQKPWDFGVKPHLPINVQYLLINSTKLINIKYQYTRV